MSADLAPWESAALADEDDFNYSSGTFDAPASREPMQLDEGDAIRDDVKEAMHDDRALLPEGFWFLFDSFRTLAETGVDPDGFAAQTLRQLVQRAKSGMPMNERSVDL